MKPVAIIQARMASTRLPGKVLADIGGRPMLWLVVERVRLAKSLGGVMVATSTNVADGAIASWCAAEGVPVFRGSENDVLDRYLGAARAASAPAVVRVTADCPLIDPDVIDLVVEDFGRGGADYVSNTIERTFPDGLDTEAMTTSALERAWREAELTSEREHVTPYIWKHPELFAIRQVAGAEDLSAMRWTVDEPADLEVVRQVYTRVPSTTAFTMRNVVDVMRSGTIAALNEGIVTNEGYLRSLANDGIASRGEDR